MLMYLAKRGETGLYSPHAEFYEVQGAPFEAPFFVENDMEKTANTQRYTAPLNKDGKLDYQQLELEWLNSSIDTLYGFKDLYCIEDKDFEKHTRGWTVKKRSWKMLFEEKITDPEESKNRVQLMWCHLLYKLGKCRTCSEQSAAEVKHITAMANALKSIHAGMGQLAMLENNEQLPAFIVEGIDIEKL